MRSVAAAGLALVLIGSTANAETRTISMPKVGIMVSPDGATRFLLGPAGNVDLANVSVDHAVIEMPLVASQLSTDIRVVAWPADGPWLPGDVPWDMWLRPGGDIRESTRGRSEVRAGTTRTKLVIAVTGALRQVVSGDPFYGFLLTVPRAYGEGFDAADAAVLQAALSSATMTVSYVPTPPERGRRGGGGGT